LNVDNKAIKELRYPKIKHDIESRLLENITDGSLKGTNDTNAVVKGLNKDKVDCATLESYFTDKVGSIKCCKVSKTIEKEGDNFTCTSNGYGFVNFDTVELLDQAIEKCNNQELEGEKLIVEKYNKDMKKDTQFNNLYVKNFSADVTEEALTKMFESFGELGSVKIMTNEDGTSKQFGFVCFKKSDEAHKAVEEMNGKKLDDGSELYVAKFEKKANRWAALKKSLARANLYVRNFDKDVTEEDLKKFFGGDEVVRNVRIMTTDVVKEDGVHKESKQFGFVSFNSPKDATDIVNKYNNEDLEFNNKQLYVNYYEDKSLRKKRLSSKKDNLMGLLDPSMMGQANGDQGNMMEYFMQIFQQYFKSFQNNSQNQSYGNGGYGGSYNQYGNGGYGGGNYNGNQRRQNNNRGHRGGYSQASSYGYQNQNQQPMYPRQPRQEYSSYAQSNPAHTAPPQVPGHMINQMAPQTQAQAPPARPPPMNDPSSIYKQTVGSIFSSKDFNALDEDGQREKIGEEIYSFVLEKSGEESAPKITGMIIDLPFADLINSVKTWEGLQEKIQEGLELLKDDQ